jgi:hypothetical protein
MLGRSHQIPLVSRSFDDRHRHGRRESHKCCVIHLMEYAVLYLT